MILHRCARAIIAILVVLASGGVAWGASQEETPQEQALREARQDLTEAEELAQAALLTLNELDGVGQLLSAATVGLRQQVEITQAEATQAQRDLAAARDAAQAAQRKLDVLEAAERGSRNRQRQAQLQEEKARREEERRFRQGQVFQALEAQVEANQAALAGARADLESRLRQDPAYQAAVAARERVERAYAAEARRDPLDPARLADLLNTRAAVRNEAEALFKAAADEDAAIGRSRAALEKAEKARDEALGAFERSLPTLPSIVAAHQAFEQAKAEVAALGPRVAAARGDAQAAATAQQQAQARAERADILHVQAKAALRDATDRVREIDAAVRVLERTLRNLDERLEEARRSVKRAEDEVQQ